MLYKKVEWHSVSSPMPLPWYVKLLKRPDRDGRYIWKTAMYLPYHERWKKQEEERMKYGR